MDEYEKLQPGYLKLLLQKNDDKMNVLELALESKSTKSINLILKKIGAF
jgi:hypothetical protein